MTLPKALLFDVFGTVVDWREGVARDLAAFFARHGLGHLDLLHRENLVAVLRDCGLDLAAIDAAELDDLNLAWHRLDPWPDAVPGLLRLKARYVIAPLSNGNVALLLNMAKRAAIPWDAILGAEVAGAYKPEPAAYLRTAEILGLHPAQCCLVAAHNNDLQAARACGLQTAFVLRAREHGPRQTTDLAPSGDWDYIAGDFGELAARLGC